MSAFRTEEPNLVLPNGPAGPVAVAGTSASGMRLAGVAPELGRLFGDEDERRGPPAVALVGHDLWQARFV